MGILHVSAQYSAPLRVSIYEGGALVGHVNLELEARHGFSLPAGAEEARFEAEGLLTATLPILMDPRETRSAPLQLLAAATQYSSPLAIAQELSALVQSLRQLQASLSQPQLLDSLAAIEKRLGNLESNLQKLSSPTS